MHTPEIKNIKNSLWENFEKILKDNWNSIFKEKKYHTTYKDGEKEITLRFRVKNIEENEVLLEVEKEIKYLTGELPVEKEEVSIII